MATAEQLPEGLASDREEARHLRDSAKLHKRAQDSHRKRVKERMQKLAALEAKWARFGVKLIEDDRVHSPSPGRPSDHSNEKGT